MIVERIEMHCPPGLEPLALEIGQTVMVEFAGLRVPMEVTEVYDDGDFEGAIYWHEA